MILSPALRALDSNGHGPRVTLAALAHLGLISAAAPRLVVANIHADAAALRYYFGRNPTNRWTRAAEALSEGIT